MHAADGAAQEHAQGEEARDGELRDGEEENGALRQYADVQNEDHDEIFPLFPAPEDDERWQAPTDLEQHLLKLSRAEDSYNYLRTLAVEGVYYPARLDQVTDADTDRGHLPMFTHDKEGRVWAPVYTEGVLPRPHPGLVYEYATLGRLASIVPDDADVLLVNPQTPCQEFLAVDDEERGVWVDLHNDLFDPDELSDRVLTVRTGPGVPEPGPLLHGLACGAHLCYGNGVPWNTLHWHGTGLLDERKRLGEWWGVHGRDDWLDIKERLLRRQVTPWTWEFALEARDALTRARGGAPVDEESWADYVEAGLRERVRRRGGPAPGQDPELEAFIKENRGLTGQVLRYEARFRADGLLPPDGTVRSVAAWDLGRASKMARWGRGARYATERELYDAVERAGAGARAAYDSWEEFSAGYVLGRCLHFDEDTFGTWYTDVLEAHRALLADPESPWRTVPFRMSGRSGT
ncbi:DUF1266 domain-containing protein [Streptomyces sp. NPDC002851]